MNDPINDSNLPPEPADGTLPSVSPDQSAPGSPTLPQDFAPPGSKIAVSLPDDAADTDLIEKEWVLKAKQIVDHTSDDPYTQQMEIGRVKADYMKKRYNKDIKLSQD